MSQPSYGNKDNVYAITPEQVKAYHDKFYVGNNIVVSGAGNIDVKKFKEAVANKFSSVRAEVIGEVPNSEEAVHTYSMVSMRDDEISNTAVMVGFRAPSWNDPDYFAMQLFKRIIGEYSVDKYTGANLNDPALQYNEFHLFLGHRPSIYVHKPYYYAYSDTGLFGNFLYGNEVFGI